jgi:pimeloyl-ACP methyl ester carboxylesterase
MTLSPANNLAETLLFLPGAAGNRQFWQPVSDGLRHPGKREFISWPGFGGEPAEPGVNGMDDLVTRVVAAMTGPVDLLAQSMGGTIAIRAALQRPELVRHLVLSVTSGGIDLATLGATDWRPEYRAMNPTLPDWFITERTDLTERLQELTMPVLLLWGDADPISPVAVGRRLAELLPRAELVVVSGGGHDLACERAREIIPLIEKHLRT